MGGAASSPYRGKANLFDLYNAKLRISVKDPDGFVERAPAAEVIARYDVSGTMRMFFKG